MVLSGSLQLPHQLGLCRNQRSSKQWKKIMCKSKLHLLNARFSSRVSIQQQDSWSIFLSDYSQRPIHSVPHKNIGFRCHSLNVAGKAIELPAIKAASLALTKSCNFVRSCPLVLQLVPAVGLLVFSLWGLVPLVRQGRNLLVNRSDNSWKKSSTYQVMTSYVQPLMLWVGALYICRAIEPVVLPTEASQLVKARLLNFVRSLSTVLAFAYCLSSVVKQAQSFFVETTDPTDARNMSFQFAGKAVYSAVWVAAVSLFMELLGFSTQRWLTAGGLGTVLLTLAGREIFTNFLSSIMIHATRPFVANEWIQTKIEGYEVSGTVEHVGWWSPTIIRGEDREAVHIPNHKFTVNVVRNLSQKTHWRIKTHLAVSHLDVNKIHNIVADMRKVLAKNPQVEQQRLHRRVFLDNINPENQALLVLISCFVKTSHHEEYLCVKEAILLDLLRVISHHRARLATPIRTVQKIYNDSDLDNIPFGDPMYDSTGTASKRPLLLIEPSYKIKGEEKTKSQNRSSRPTSEQESKTLVQSTSDSKTESKFVSTIKPTDPKSNETHTIDPNPNSKMGEAPNSDAKVADDTTVKTVSRPIPKANPKGKEAPPISESKSRNSWSSKLKSPRHDGQVGLLGSTGETEKDRAEGALASQPSVSRSALEENIVLGVALEGSKRTLPIEEEIDDSPTPMDSREMATSSRPGPAPLTSDKEKKDGNVQGHTSTSSEH